MDECYVIRNTFFVTGIFGKLRNQSIGISVVPIRQSDRLVDKYTQVHTVINCLPYGQDLGICGFILYSREGRSCSVLSISGVVD